MHRVNLAGCQKWGQDFPGMHTHPPTNNFDKYWYNSSPPLFVFLKKKLFVLSPSAMSCCFLMPFLLTLELRKGTQCLFVLVLTENPLLLLSSLFCAHSLSPARRWLTLSSYKTKQRIYPSLGFTQREAGIIYAIFHISHLSSLFDGAGAFRIETC